MHLEISIQCLLVHVNNVGLLVEIIYIYMYCVGQLTMSYNTYTFLDDENEENKVKLEFLSLEKMKMEELRT